MPRVLKPWVNDSLSASHRLGESTISYLFEAEGGFQPPPSADTRLRLVKKIKSGRLLVIMKTPKLKVKKKLDWLRIAFIVNSQAGMSLDQITFVFNEMFKNGKTNREISRIIICYQRHGFEYEIRDRTKHYSFTGKFPDLNRRTLQRWEEKIQSLKGLI